MAAKLKHVTESAGFALVVFTVIILELLFSVRARSYFGIGLGCWLLLACAFLWVRGGTFLMKVDFAELYSTLSADGKDRRRRNKYILLTIFLIFFLCIACIVPMKISPAYNGVNPGQRVQYEQLADALIQGRLYTDVQPDPRLFEMDNPYDPEARAALGILNCDYSFYHGHYYVYFGVVPCLLLFVPYKLLTGSNLTTYHATQIFTVLGIIGLFYLFWMLSRDTFRRTRYGTYCYLAGGISVISFAYAVQAPALYCTAITGGMCLEIWSLVCFYKAAFEPRIHQISASKKTRRGKLALFVLGSLLGALVFGCRPTIGLANVAFFPSLYYFWKKDEINSSGEKKNRKISSVEKEESKTGTVNLRRRTIDMILVFLPYVIVAIALMLYNYARYDNPFEFG